jgi:hypothetical protein
VTLRIATCKEEVVVVAAKAKEEVAEAEVH